MYGGFPALEDDTFMVRGAIMQAVATLAIYDQKTGNLRFADNLRRMSSFSSLFIGQPTKTWGKLKLLMGLSDLMDAGLLASVSPETIAIYRQASDYSDFLDKETLFLHGLPTNYYHVAMACAAYREKLGWENEGMADRIRDKILGVIQDHSSEGWSDEQPPHGRFDIYSINVPMELVPPLMQTGHEVPPSALENLRKGDLLFTLPLIGGGRRFLHAAYLPFPAMPRLLEAPQDHPIPFLTPHYTLADGRLALPAGFYENIQVEQGEDRVVIAARGRLSLSDPPRLGGNPEANAPYTAVYTFAGSSVSAQFDTEAKAASVKMLYAGDTYVEGAGFDTAEPLDVSEQKYHTPHGAPVRGIQWTGKNAWVGYTVTISGS